MRISDRCEVLPVPIPPWFVSTRCALHALSLAGPLIKPITVSTDVVHGGRDAMEIDPIKAALARTLGMTVPQVGEAATRADRALRTSGPLKFDKDGALKGQPKLSPTRVHEQQPGSSPSTAEGPSSREGTPTESSRWQDVVTSRATGSDGLRTSDGDSAKRKDTPKKAILPPRFSAPPVDRSTARPLQTPAHSETGESPLASDPFWRNPIRARAEETASADEQSLGDATQRATSQPWDDDSSQDESQQGPSHTEEAQTDETQIEEALEVDHEPAATTRREYVSFGDLRRARVANEETEEAEEDGSSFPESARAEPSAQEFSFESTDVEPADVEPAEVESEYVESEGVEDAEIEDEVTHELEEAIAFDVDQSPAFADQDDEPTSVDGSEEQGECEFDPADESNADESTKEDAWAREEEGETATTVDVETHLSDQVFVPSGPFLYSEAREERSLPAYWMDKYPVTNADYEVFTEETGHRAPAYWPQGQLPRALRDHPVVGVDYFDALAYASWVGKDLPFEDEWERAARGRDGRIFPWGNEPELSGANTARAGVRCTVSVDTHKINISPEGCWDMVGNCWELTHSPAPGGGVVVRGGSWYDFALYAKTYFRFASRPDVCNGTIGFRCVRRDSPRDDERREVDPGLVAEEINKRRGKRALVDWTSFSAERRDLVPDFAHLARMEAESREREFAERPLRPTSQQAARSSYTSPLTPSALHRNDLDDESMPEQRDDVGVATGQDDELANNGLSDAPAHPTGHDSVSADSSMQDETDHDASSELETAENRHEDHQQDLQFGEREDDEIGMDSPASQEDSPASTPFDEGETTTAPSDETGTAEQSGESHRSNEGEGSHDERVHVDAHGGASIGRRSPTGAYVPLHQVMAEKVRAGQTSASQYAPGQQGMKLGGAPDLSAERAARISDAIEQASRKGPSHRVEIDKDAKSTPLWMWVLLALAFAMLGYWLWTFLSKNDSTSNATVSEDHASLADDEEGSVPEKAGSNLPKLPAWGSLASDTQPNKTIDLAHTEEFEQLKDGAWIFVFVDPMATTGNTTIREAHAVHRRLIGWGIKTAVVIPPSIAEREDGETMSDAELARRLYAHRNFLRDGIYVIRDVKTERHPEGALCGIFGTKGKRDCASLAVLGRLTQRTWSNDNQPMRERHFRGLMERALMAIGWDGSPTPPSAASAPNETSESRWSDPAAADPGSSGR